MGTRIGLDIGIASVGWCVVDEHEHRILGLGVRTFPKAENPKDGAPLAQPRRMARSLRRRLRRRRQRMAELRQLFLQTGLLVDDDFDDLYVTTAETKDPFQLRCEGLDRALDNREWARVLTQLCKRRGYKSMRLGPEPEADDGLVKAAISANADLMQSQGYRTPGEMLVKDGRFASAKRNHGSYHSVISRGMLVDEIRTLFAQQRMLGSEFASEGFEERYLSVLSSQASIAEGQSLITQVGACQFESLERRSPKACPSFEVFRLRDKLNNVRWSVDGSTASLSLDDKEALLDKAMRSSTQLTYATLRKECGIPDDAHFVGITDTRDRNASEKKAKLPPLAAWHRMRAAVSKYDKSEWVRLSRDIALLDDIAETLTYWKMEDSVRARLADHRLDPNVVEALSELRFAGHAHLSRKALSGILPYLQQGQNYSDACASAGYNHSGSADGPRSRKLPPVPADEIRNPVVLRALSQSRKVLNAIIDHYGSPTGVTIELARDMSKSFKERREIEKEQHEGRDRIEIIRKQIAEVYGVRDPRPHDLVKYRLWLDQNRKCIYTGADIDPERMLSGEPGVAEVDHVLPYSRSFDNSYANRVLVTAAANQEKAGQTPWEWLGSDEARWNQFEARVLSTPSLRMSKRRRLLRRDFDPKAEEEFRDRNLNDTRYIARYFKNFVEGRLEFLGDERIPVRTVNGSVTAYLRARWGLSKARSEGGLHHALDAAVVATTTRSMIKSITDFCKAREARGNIRLEGWEYVDPRTGEHIEAKHIPQPWEGFREELLQRLEPSAEDYWNAVLSGQPAPAGPQPVLVSRAPRHKMTGEAHAETIRRIEGTNEAGMLLTSKRVRLESLKLAALENMVGKESDRRLYEILRSRLESNDDNPKKAFADPVYKPSKSSEGPIVRAIRVYDKPSSGGTHVRGGLADNQSMVRTDVFEKDGEFYLVPVYARDVAARRLPTRAITGGKAESEWPLVDDSFDFCFSLHADDLVRIERRSSGSVDVLLGYFDGTNRRNGSIALNRHDNSGVKWGSIGARRLLSFEKLQPDVLGLRVARVREKRLGFS